MGGFTVSGLANGKSFFFYIFLAKASYNFGSKGRRQRRIGKREKTKGVKGRKGGWVMERSWSDG